ncbi:MAG: STAS domain-containing protein [Cyclobacteriaceae bacterium]|nr:STAS domain-containing protein [Cyclobacteriaceae bacterium]
MNSIFKPKLFSILKAGYSKEQFYQDALSGVVVGIVALPLAIAFAVASGVSPEKGLITAIIAGFLISFLGGSRVQIGGPTGAFIVIVYGIIQQYGIDGLIISTILAGLLLIVFGIFKMGSLLKFFPHPMIVGFTSGIALVIFSTQIKDAFGLTLSSVPSEFLYKWKVYFLNLDTANFYAIAITVITILIIQFSKNLTKKIPGSFIAIILITSVVQIFNLPVSSIETFFGEIPRTFSISIPNFHFEDLAHYLEPALAIALLGGIESLLSAVVADGMIGANHRSNTELIAQGIANVITPFFGGIPATGAIARTATNVKNGGRTPIAGMVHAITLALIMLFVGQWAKLIPMSVLAGILIVVAYNMSEWRSFIGILKEYSFDSVVLLTTFALTVLVDLTLAIEVGVVLSSLLFMKRMADAGKRSVLEVDSDVLEDYETLPSEISIFEISGPLFFGSAKQYNEMLKATGFRNKILILRMRHVPFIDSTGMHNLTGLLKDMAHSGIQVFLSGVKPEVRKDLDRINIAGIIGEGHIFDSFGKAVEHAKKHLQRE